MEETLQGVIVGGLIASLATFGTLFFQYKQWKKTKKIEQLRIKRARMEEVFSKIWRMTEDNLKTGRFDTHVYTDVLFLCPKNVKMVYDDFVKKDDLSEDDKLYHQMCISMEMKKALSEIDDEIDREIS